MIGWEDVYKVIVATVPLYVALILGYGSVRWWHIFTPEKCDAINRLVCYFTLPLFTFEFTAHVDPFEWDYMFIAADVISKVIIVVVLAFWAKFSTKGSYGWSITSFSLCTLTNSLVVGVPLMKAMYGEMGVNLVIQSSVWQAIIWLTILLFVLEFRRAGIDISSSSTSNSTTTTKTMTTSTNCSSRLVVQSVSVVVAEDDPPPPPPPPPPPSPPAVRKDVEMMADHHQQQQQEEEEEEDAELMLMSSGSYSFWSLMKVVWLKLAMNPNSYACVIGIAWAFIANRWHIQMPSMMEGSILIMSKAGTGTAMFSMGIFMALQEKIIGCGACLTVFGMALKFIAGPAAMAIGAIAVGLHGDVLRVAIIQAALPQSITSFIYAKEYGLHADVLSTAVIFGMIVSLPILIAYFAVLEFVN